MSNPASLLDFPLSHDLDFTDPKDEWFVHHLYMEAGLFRIRWDKIRERGVRTPDYDSELLPAHVAEIESKYKLENYISFLFSSIEYKDYRVSILVMPERIRDRLGNPINADGTEMWGAKVHLMDVDYIYAFNEEFRIASRVRWGGL